MRVGVYFPRVEETIGGGHTFEMEVLRSLARLGSADCSHDLLALTDLVDLPEGFDWGRLEPVDVKEALRPPQPPQPIPPSRSLPARVKRLLFPPAPVPPPPPPPDLIGELVRRHRLDFIYNPTPQTMYLELPYIVTVWDLQHRRQPQFPEVSAEGTWQAREAEFSRVLRRATRIIAGTQVGLDELERFYGIPPERIEILPHPTPMSVLDSHQRDAQRVRMKYGLRRDFVLYPAQFWPHKNHIGLLHALKVLHERGRCQPDLVLSGSDQGNMGHVRRTVDELGLTDRVHLLGFVPREDLLDLYSGAMALVYVTYFGPENLPPLEAFGVGCPVVASRVAGADEQLGDAALLVDPNSEAEIATAVERLHASPTLRAELIQRGKERALRHTSDTFVRGVVGILDRCALQRRCWAAA